VTLVNDTLLAEEEEVEIEVLEEEEEAVAEFLSRF
jgi:hypothetical protein